MTLAKHGAALLITLTLAPGCSATPSAERHIPFAIATGGPGGAFNPMGKALVEVYREHLPGADPSLVTGGSTQNIEAVESGEAALGFTQADVAYVAYRRGTDAHARPLSELRGVAMLWMNTVHVAVPQSSNIQSIRDLGGRRVAVGTRGSGTETLARIVLESYGLTYDRIDPAFLTFPDMTAQMRRGDLDAIFVVGGLPADTLTDLSVNPGVRMLPIPRDQVRAMRAQYPFLQPLTLTSETYPGIGAVESVGVSSLLISRSTVDEELVYRLTRKLFTALPRLWEAHPAVRLIDPEQAPATPIPLHPGAARYYRERQLTQ